MINPIVTVTAKTKRVTQGMITFSYMTVLWKTSVAGVLPPMRDRLFVPSQNSDSFFFRNL